MLLWMTPAAVARLSGGCMWLVCLLVATRFPMTCGAQENDLAPCESGASCEWHDGAWCDAVSSSGPCMGRSTRLVASGSAGSQGDTGVGG